MKLIWHEFKNLAQRWKWIIPLWWLILVADYGYQAAWWWEGWFGWNDYSAFHDTASWLVRSAVEIGLCLPAIILFNNSSPTLKPSAQQLMPMSKHERFASVITVLCLWIGLPWWLHESCFLIFESESPFSFILRGTLERVAETLAIWFVCGVIGWVSDSLKQVAMILGIAFVTAIVGSMVCESLGWNTETKLISLEALDATRVDIIDRYGKLVQIASIFAVGGGFLIWLGIKQKFTNPPAMSIWIISGLMGLTHVVISNRASAFITDVLITRAVSTYPNEAKKIVTRLESNTKVNASPNPEISPTWLVLPKPAARSEFYSDIVAATGFLNYSDGTQLSLSDTRQKGYYGSAYRLEVFCTENFTSDFPEYYFYGDMDRGSARREDEATLYVHPEDHQYPSPESKITSASAKLTFDLLKPSNWQSLPLDGKHHSLGSLGTARFNGVNGTDISLTIQPTSLFTSLENAVSPHRVFALVHDKRKQMVLIYKDSRRLVRGKGSAAPIQELTLSMRSGLLPKDLSTQGWLHGAELKMMETHLVGRSYKEFSTTAIDFNTVSVHHQQNYNLFTPSETYIPKNTAWASSHATTSEVRQALYESLRIRPGKVEVPAFAREHTDFIRRSALEMPNLISLFHGHWNDDDRDWFLSQAEAAPSLLKDADYGFAAQLEEQEWLDLRPNWVKRMLKSNHWRAKEIANKAAKRLGFETDKDRDFRRELHNLSAISRVIKRTENPEVWDQVKTDFENRFSEERWNLHSARSGFPSWYLYLARMGDPTGLRERLESYIHYAPELEHESAAAWFAEALNTWKTIRKLLGLPAESDPKTTEQLVAEAKRLLAAKWEFDPETMTYHLQP